MLKTFSLYCGYTMVKIFLDLILILYIKAQAKIWFLEITFTHECMRVCVFVCVCPNNKRRDFDFIRLVE